MTIKRYKELKKKYFHGVSYNNCIEMRKVGFHTDYGLPIPELDVEPGVQRWVCNGDAWYRVYAPQNMKYEEV